MTATNPPQEDTVCHGYAIKRKTYNQFIKRVLDLGMCFCFLPVATFIMALIGAAIVLDSRGPAFFIQERVGKHGCTFRMYKFRTMRQDHDSAMDRMHMKNFVGGAIETDHERDGVIYKPDHNASITRMGRLLRKSSLDELPQLINVLRGEMSLIGPRPNLACEVEAYADWHYKRLAVLPGITGWAQVHGRSSIPFDAIAAYDIEYVDACCFKLDLCIFWLTMRQVLFGNGAG